MLPAHRLLTIKGVFGSTTAPIEVWQWSVKTPVDNWDVTPDASAMTTYLGAVQTAYTNHIRSLHRNSVIATELRVDVVEESGKVRVRPDGSYVSRTSPVTIAGTGTGGANMPLQTACAVTLTTSRGGPTGKGRVFLPQVAQALDADYRYSDAVAQAIAVGVRDFINAVNNNGPDVHVFSSKGYSSPVTGVRCGRAPDTQRRRRGEVLESYYSLPLS